MLNLLTKLLRQSQGLSEMRAVSFLPGNAIGMEKLGPSFPKLLTGILFKDPLEPR
jgi:hypothetical protein